MKALATLAAMLAAILPASVAGAQSLDPAAEAVLSRARSSTSTYTIYWRVQRSDGGSLEFNWGATFRKGSLVRVEDVASRAVADCAVGKGMQSYISIGYEYSAGPKIARRYCGIDSDRRVRATRWVGQKQGQFGLVDEVEVVDEDGTFTYLVTVGGEVVGVTGRLRGSSTTIVAEPMSFDRTVPPGDLFSRLSLASSRVPKIVQSQGARAAN
ncbi:hypothetical protein [Sphingomonas sp.]|uniref:hypothetical protein n=1 Tax=Sphingomonas sp. TaxID=28214 RepID=UPI00286C2127|nr:hypothetical protein [Sphingomonas sp.]